MRLKDCHNFGDFRKLAKRKLPSPIFHYIDGAADDEITYNRNTSAFQDVTNFQPEKSFLQDEASYKTGCHDPLENRFEE